MEVRTRFAPSPTGFMHIGGVRTALYAFLIAKKNNGKFILRIEDTDQERYVEGAIEVIYRTLTDLGLIWDEGPDIGGDYGPYIQSERKANYLKCAEKLIEEGKAYYCFCSEERLSELKERDAKLKIPYKYDRCCREIPLEEAKKRVEAGEKHVIRFKMPKEGETVFNDLIYGEIVVDNKEIEDLIIIKSDKMPTYNFANIIDDHEMKITHVIRGNEYISSTPKYILIYKALGWPIPEFIHLPIIKKNKYSDKKLSKRDGDATVEALKAKGYLNEAIINMLALTGWSPGDEREIFSLDELIGVFDPKNIGKSNAIFDIDKLNWLNNHYIKEASIETVKSITLPHLEKVYDLSEKSDAWLEELILLYKDQISYGEEIVEVSKIFFKDDIEYGNEELKILNAEGVNAMLNIFYDEIVFISDWNVESIARALDLTKERSGLKGKMLYMPIRVKVTGSMHGPELPNTIYLLGKEKVLKRLK